MKKSHRNVWQGPDNPEPRTVSEELSFVEAREKIKPDTRQWDDAFIGTEFVLARRPDLGIQVSKSVWVMEAEMDPNVLIYYTFDSEKVYLLYAEIHAKNNGYS